MFKMLFLLPGMFSKIKTFTQCTPYMYILIYIKGSKCLQTAVYIYIYIMNRVRGLYWENIGPPDGMNLWILCASKADVNPIVDAIFNTI